MAFAGLLRLEPVCRYSKDNVDFSDWPAGRRYHRAGMRHGGWPTARPVTCATIRDVLPAV